MFVACCGLGILFITCELSQRLGNAFTEIERIIEQFDWYLFPLNIRRLLPTIIIIAQEPVNLECFGSISCNREFFKKVCSIFSGLYSLIAKENKIKMLIWVMDTQKFPRGLVVLLVISILRAFNIRFTGGEHCFLVLYDAPSIQQMR